MNDRRIRELVEEGATDLLDVASVTGAGSFCGGCVPAIASLLSKATGVPASALLDDPPSRVSEQAPSLPTRVRQVVRAVEEELLASPSGTSPTVTVDQLRDRHDATGGVVRDALDVLVCHGTLRPADTPADVYVPDDGDAGAVRTLTALHLRMAGVTAEETLDVRRVLEGLAVQCACRHPDDAAWEQFVDARHGAGGDPADDADFHLAVAGVAGNPALTLLVGSLLALDGLVGSGDDADGVPPHAAPPHPAHAAIATAIARRDTEQASAALAADLRTRPACAPHRPPPRPGRPLDVAAAVVELALAQGRGGGEQIGTEREVADALGIDRRRLRAAVPLLEYRGLATRQPGPRATLGVATADPWPSAELLAMAMELAGAEPGQLLHVRQALEVRAVELASARIDDHAAARLRQRLDEESAALRRGRLHDRVFHTIHPVLAELSGNRVLAHAAIALNLALLRRANRDPDLAQFLASGVGELTATHAAIVDAATRGDVRTSRRLMGAHVAQHGGHDAAPRS